VCSSDHSRADPSICDLPFAIRNRVSGCRVSGLKGSTVWQKLAVRMILTRKIGPDAPEGLAT
jgi:hypothetical protein